jgi:alpha-galactosidase
MKKQNVPRTILATKPAVLLATASFSVCIWLGSTAATSSAQSAPSPGTSLAAKPPMGWNSWDSFGLRINEEQFVGNVDVLATKLKRFGYDTAVIDEGWFMVNPEDRPHPERLRYQIDANGRYIPVPARFPSAEKNGSNLGFQEIARRIHARGLKFGIHIVRGIPRVGVKQNLPIAGSSYKLQDAADQSDACPWDPTNWGVMDNAAGQAWYDSLLRQYADWGVDLLKVDCIADHPYKVSEIRQIHLAIQRSGRPMILSLSPGPTALSHAQEVASLAQMWRISNDIWDVWSTTQPFPKSVKSQFDPAAQWAPFAHSGNWPDADMLPVGELSPSPDVGNGPRHTRLTVAEQQTQLSLWSFARSPLILGANLMLLDQPTKDLLTNKDILAIDQTSTDSRQVLHDGDLVVWTSDLPKERHAVGIFNVGDLPMKVRKTFQELGLPAGLFKIRDAWKKSSLAKSEIVEAEIAPHAVMVLTLRR